MQFFSGFYDTQDPNVILTDWKYFTACHFPVQDAVGLSMRDSKEGAGTTEGYGHLCKRLQTSFPCVMHIPSQRANFPVEEDLMNANSIVHCALYRTSYSQVQIHNQAGIFHREPEFRVVQRECFQNWEKSPSEVLTDLWCSGLLWLYKLIPIFKSILKWINFS